MPSRVTFRLMPLVAAMGALSACQPLFDEADPGSIGARRLAAAPPVNSAQRLDEDGYPLLGAYPRAANAQFSDAEVAGIDGQLSSAARSRASASGQNTQAAYQARLRQAEAAKRRQAGQVRALASSGDAEAQASGPASPQEILRRIEGSSQDD